MALEVDGVDVYESHHPRAWVTIVLSVVALGMSVVASVAVAIALFALAPAMWTDGMVLTLSLLTGAAVIVPLVILFAHLQTGSAFDFLGLRMPPIGTLAKWIFVTFAVVLATDSLTWLLGYEVVPEVMLDTYEATPIPVLLWLGVIIAAPLSEEFLFRGYLFQGLLNTRLGLVGTAIITSAVWALLHGQYEALFYKAVIFCFGLVLAAARYRSQSLITCICMHGTMNLIATLETLYVLSQLPIEA